jgi:hypothetical protein
MKIEDIESDSSIVNDMARRAVDAEKKRAIKIRDASKRAKEASNQRTKNLRSNLAASKRREKHREELKKVSEDGLTKDIQDDLDSIKADETGSLEKIDPRRRRKKVRKI